MSGRGGFIAAYLLATPVFVIADVAFDMPFRVAAPFDRMSLINVVLSGSVLLYGYYGYQAAALSRLVTPSGRGVDRMRHRGKTQFPI